MNVIGPNTLAPAELVRPDCLVFAGEDRDVVRTAIAGRIDHSYRGYDFIAARGASAIVCGIGMACLEPLLWEILSVGLVRRVVLVGSAGCFPGARVEIGRPYVVREAYSAGTGLDVEAEWPPATPNWDRLPPDVAVARSVSTDFFYGFAPRLLNGNYPLRLERLRERYERYRHMAELVEMEAAPFYALCRAFGGDDLQHIAVKGVSNVLQADEQQQELTAGVLERCAGVAWRLLGRE